MEFTVEAVTYRAGTMDAIKQFHCARRLMGLLGLVGEVQKMEQGTRTMEDVLGSLGRELSQMEDEPLNYILYACMDITEVKQDGGGWAPFRRNGTTMFPVDLAVLLKIAVFAIKANMAGFMRARSELSGMGTMMQSAG